MAVQWRCTLCGQCCKSYTPFVLPGDVQRIQGSVNVPTSSFLAFYYVEDFEDTLREVDRPYFFHTRHGPLAMCLARVWLPSSEAGCVFLRGNLCSIHTARPLICRSYPFQPQDPGNVEGPFRLIDDPCFGRHATDEVVDEGPVRENHRTFQYQQEQYFEKVREWNDDPSCSTQDIEDFLSFVGLQWS